MEAAADVERGHTQGVALDDKQAGALQRRTGGGSSCPPGQVELLGHVLDCVIDEAGLGHRDLEEPNFVYVPHVNQTQPQVALLYHWCGHRTTQRTCGGLRCFVLEVSCSSELW